MSCPRVLSDWSLYSNGSSLKIPVVFPWGFFFFSLRSALGPRAGPAGSAKELAHRPGAALELWCMDGSWWINAPTPRQMFSTVSQHSLCSWASVACGGNLLDKLASFLSKSHCFTSLLVFSRSPLKESQASLCRSPNYNKKPVGIIKTQQLRCSPNPYHVVRVPLWLWHCSSMCAWECSPLWAPDLFIETS